jgi:hypothetical protein
VNELYTEIENKESLTQRYFGLSLKKFLIASFLVVAMGIYMGVLLFGVNSLVVLMNIDDYSNNLQAKIDVLKAQNAKDQKTYFELQEISAK